MDIAQQIREKLDIHPYKDSLRLTWGFMVPVGYNNIGHLGIDVGEKNRMFGDNLYAPFDGTVKDPRRWLGKGIGWEFYMQSDPIVVDGKKCVIRCGYIHTRGKSTLKSGDKVKAGDLVDISGGTFSIGSFWSGQHTHIWIMPRYMGTDAREDYWQPEWGNGSVGYIDPLTIQEDNTLEDVERVYFYFKNKSWKYWGPGATSRMRGALIALKLTKKYKPRAMLFMLWDYTAEKEKNN